MGADGAVKRLSVWTPEGAGVKRPSYPPQATRCSRPSTAATTGPFPLGLRQIFIHKGALVGICRGTLCTQMKRRCLTNGNSRILFPVAAKMAFPSAGAAVGVAASPTPLISSPLS